MSTVPLQELFEMSLKKTNEVSFQALFQRFCVMHQILVCTFLFIIQLNLTLCLIRIKSPLLYLIWLQALLLVWLLPSLLIHLIWLKHKCRLIVSFYDFFDVDGDPNYKTFCSTVKTIFSSRLKNENVVVHAFKSIYTGGFMRITKRALNSTITWYIWLLMFWLLGPFMKQSIDWRRKSYNVLYSTMLIFNKYHYFNSFKRRATSSRTLFLYSSLLRSRSELKTASKALWFHSRSSRLFLLNRLFG